MGIMVKQFLMCWRRKDHVRNYKQIDDNETKYLGSASKSSSISPLPSAAKSASLSSSSLSSLGLSLTPVINNNNNPRQVNWNEILGITDNLSSEFAVGGFSCVYIGNFFGQPCAVKVVNKKSLRAVGEFQRELKTLTSVSHANIVKLLAYCDQPDGKALVLKYYRKGTLYDNLRSSKTKTKSSKVVLTWQQRKHIALSIAGAVDYLHSGCSPAIVHGDIKSANIMLDEDMKAILCDFGSARGESTSSRSSSNEMLIESPGYMDPHYLRTGLIAASKDVFSFGVVLAEILTGLPALAAEEEDGRPQPQPQPQPRLLWAYARPVLGQAQRCLAILDPVLLLCASFSAQQAQAMANIASRCLAHDPVLRPTMKEVVTCLSRL